MKNKSDTFIINLQSTNNNNQKNFPNQCSIKELLKAKYIEENKILNHNFELNNNFNMWVNTTKEPESSLIEGFIQAYLNNCSITLNPDIIWLLIMQGFSRYMYLNKRAGNINIINDRKIKKIMITKENFYPLKSKENDWKDVIHNLYIKINSLLLDKGLEKLLPKFSTTDSMSIIACHLFLLFKKNKIISFEKREITKGNISNIILEGYLDDYQSILTKIKYLDKIGLNWWTKELKIILENIIKTKNAKTSNSIPNINFWKNMIFCEEKNSNENNSNLSSIGWLFKFFPDFEKKMFVKSFNKLKIPSSSLSIPFSLSKHQYLKRIEYECNFELSIFWEIITQNIYHIQPRLKYIIICSNIVNKKNYIKIINNFNNIIAKTARSRKTKIRKNSSNSIINLKTKEIMRRLINPCVKSVEIKKNEYLKPENLGYIYFVKNSLKKYEEKKNQEEKISSNLEKDSNIGQKTKDNKICLKKSDDENNQLTKIIKPVLYRNTFDLINNRMNIYSRRLIKDEKYNINKSIRNKSQKVYIEKLNDRMRQKTYLNPMLKDSKK